MTTNKKTAPKTAAPKAAPKVKTTSIAKVSLPAWKPSYFLYDPEEYTDLDMFSKYGKEKGITSSIHPIKIEAAEVTDEELAKLDVVCLRKPVKA